MSTGSWIPDSWMAREFPTLGTSARSVTTDGADGRQSGLEIVRTLIRGARFVGRFAPGRTARRAFPPSGLQLRISSARTAHNGRVEIRPSVGVDDGRFSLSRATAKTRTRSMAARTQAKWPTSTSICPRGNNRRVECVRKRDSPTPNLRTRSRLR